MNEQKPLQDFYDNLSDKMVPAPEPAKNDQPERVTFAKGEEFLFKGVRFTIAMINKTNMVIRPAVGRFLIDEAQPNSKPAKKHRHGVKGG